MEEPCAFWEVIVEYYDMNKLRPILAVVLLLMSSCHRQPDEFRPKIQHTVQDTYLKQLSSPFPPLSQEQRWQDWGKEYTIGLGFAKQLELYQAMTAFKRATFLLPPSLHERLLELEYDVVLCYYLGQKWPEVAYAFERGALRNISAESPAFHDLLVILYDSYLKQDEEKKASGIITCMQTHFPETAEKLTLSTALLKADFPELKHLASSPQPPAYLQEFLTAYKRGKKSPGTAQTLNALLPGAGYLYLGQKQSALTAFLLNGLFIAASYHFYDHHQIAAGTIFASFELGWYFGGIFGAGIEAKYYNERLYESLATPMMNQERLFPILNLKYAF